ncbi:MAG: transcriptional regulator [Myxococcaceae bacterium]|nr:transcriptional regulator [Myxococcaceae bacterium]
MIHRFGAFELDDRLFELRKWSTGELVPIQPKAFDILSHLLEHRETVVSRGDLMVKVWPGVVVTNDSLAQAIMSARAALGDVGDSSTFIQTVRGRGYRFIAKIESAPGPEDVAPPAPPERIVASSALLGRGASLATLGELVERARSGRGGICLVTGETGVGKTRLVEELCDGTEAIFVRCYAGEGAPELWPFAQALRALAARGAVIEGDLAALADGRLAETTLADPQARFALFDGTARALIAHAAKSPLVLAIDDLQYADLHTLRLVALLSPQLRSAPLLFVGLYGPTPPRLPSFRAAMGALAQEPTTSTVRLEALGREDVASFVRQVTGRTVTEASIDKVFEKTRGNPLLLSQLVHVLATDGLIGREEMATTAMVGGEGMRDAITSMLAALPDSATRVLTLAAVLGPVFPVAPLAAALAETNDVVLRELDAADVARVVARAGASSYRFTYPLVRDVLYKRMLASERARLHERVATALEEHLGDDRDHRRVAEIAGHLIEAAAAGDVDRAVDCSLRAAELAITAGDHAAASSYAKRGLEAFAFAQRPDEKRRSRLATFLAKG